MNRIRTLFAFLALPFATAMLAAAPAHALSSTTEQPLTATIHFDPMEQKTILPLAQKIATVTHSNPLSNHLDGHDFYGVIYHADNNDIIAVIGDWNDECKNITDGPNGEDPKSYCPVYVARFSPGGNSFRYLEKKNVCITPYISSMKFGTFAKYDPENQTVTLNTHDMSGAPQSGCEASITVK